MTRNDITGDLIASRPANNAYRSAWERIFNKPESTPCDCIGGKVDGRPCPVCCPTDDGPDERKG